MHLIQFETCGQQAFWISVARLFSVGRRGSDQSKLGARMTKRQALLRLRDDTENDLNELRSMEHEDSTDSYATALATHLKDLTGVVSLLDLGLAKRGLEKLCN